jgi:hypothetical protein
MKSIWMLRSPKAVQLKPSLASRMLATTEIAGMFLTATGATLSMVFGRVVLAIVLAALAMGLFLRFSSRAKSRAAPMPALQGWVRPVSVLLSLVETAVMVEATQLPVRFGQPGFELYHWPLVMVVFAVAYTLQVSLFRRLGKRPE